MAESFQIKIDESHKELKKFIQDVKAQLDESVEKEVKTLNKHITTNVLVANNQDIKKLITEVRTQAEDNLSREINTINRHISLLQSNREETLTLNQNFEEKVEAKLNENSNKIAQLQERLEKNTIALDERLKGCYSISSSIDHKLEHQILPGLQKKIKENAELVEEQEKRNITQFATLHTSLQEKVNIDDLAKLQSNMGFF